MYTHDNEVVKKITESLKETTTEKVESQKTQEPTAQEQLDALLAKGKEFGFNLSETLKVSRLKKQIRNQTRSRLKRQQGFQEFFLKPQQKRQKQLMQQVKIVFDTIGKQDFKMLKDVFTVTTPEQKDDNGMVIQPEKKQINWQGLLLEAKNVITIQREQRMKNGTRQRTTGNSNARRAHKAALKFLLNRDAEEQAKGALK